VTHEIAVHQLAKQLEDGVPVYLLDVRQPWEHDIAALPGSHLIPLDQLTTRTDEITPPDGSAIVVYCHHGIRSRSAAVLLERLGFRDVASLAGGIDAWSIQIDPKTPRY
jgi:adenylyltransferase/sulfurtransferase